MNRGGRLKELKEKLHLKHTELLVLLIFFLFSLRVLNWFEYPYIVVGGDFRPPLVHEAFLKRITYTWDEIDFGIPSVYTPRILDPFYFFVTAFQILGVSLYLSQIIAVFLIYLFSSILMYIFVKQVTNGNITASFVAALYLTSNVYLINDREVTAIGFMNITLIILPCLVTFVKGIKTCSYKLMAVSGILFVLTYATFPNYRASLICLFMLGLVLLFYFMSRGLEISLNSQKNSRKLFKVLLDTSLLRRYLKLLLVFALTVLLASFWLITLIFSNIDFLTTMYTEMAPQSFTVAELKLYDVTRFIAYWGFYDGWGGKPYVPYRDVYLNNPLIIALSYSPTILAFASLLIPKSRKLTIYFSGVAVLSLLLTSAFNPYLGQLYSVLINIPLMATFRTSTNWIFFAVLSYCILIGITFSTLCHMFRKRILHMLVLGIAFVLFLSTTYPLTTGDVTRNWLSPNIKGSYLPSSYHELNNMLPSEYWSILLPQRSVYVVYNFTRSPFVCGNPYPLIFSKPIISGTGTEYVQVNQDLINRFHELIRTNTNGVSKFLGMAGIKYAIVEKNIVWGSLYPASELKLNECKDFRLVTEWDEVAVFENTYASQKLYVADNIIIYSTLDDMQNFSANSTWSTLRHSAFVNANASNGLTDKTLRAPENFAWKEVSPTSYEAHLTSKGPFILVFLERYDEHWKVNVNGKLIRETNHQKVNAFANGWLIHDTGNLAITIQYETQNLLAVSVVASVILPTLLLTFLSRRDIKRVASLIQRRFKRKID